MPDPIPTTLTTTDPATPPATPPAVPTWLDALPDDLKGNEVLKTAKLDEVVQSYLNRPVVPEKPEGYVIPQGAAPDPAMLLAAHKVGLTQPQLDALLKFSQESAQMSQNAVTAATQKGLTELKTQWGAEFDSNVVIAKRVLKQFDTPDKALSSMLQTTGAGNNKVVIEFFHRLGKVLSEDGYLKSGDSGSNTPKSLAETLYPKGA